MRKLSTFFCALLLSSAAFAQIPNASFETWTTHTGYDTPDSWANLDSVTNAASVYTCEKATPGYSGTAFMKLTSKTVPIVGVVPGVAVCGTLDMTTFMPKSGFAYSSRPGNLSGAWQYMAYGADAGHIAVLLSKWNTSLSRRDTVAFTNYALPGMVMVWGTFSIPLTYFSAATPDSAIIVLSASGATPVANSYLWVDTLAFTGTAPTGITSIATNQASFSVSPNPSTSTTTILYNSVSENNIVISINGIDGRSVTNLSLKTIIGENKFAIDVSDFGKGIYIIRVADGQNTQVQKLIVE